MAEADKPKRRLVKRAETVREKAEKASSEENKQPRRLHKAKRGAAAPFRALGALGRRLGKYRVLHIISLIIVWPYFRNSWKELRQVTWLKPKESLRLTWAVVLFAAVFGTMVALLDYGLDKIFKQVLIK
ncbi:MAG TPA: preprotein translocase subunit SecE [Candidatus Saccharimonadales bacterium]